MEGSSFRHVISLGFFCSVAKELEQLGLRDASYPFDWVISDFKGIIDCLCDNFEHFFDMESFCQHPIDKEYYINNCYKLWFYHDFSLYKPLAKQFGTFKRKYNRRIARFLAAIAEPTLFIRYVQADDAASKDEVEYLEKNIVKIRQILKNYNSKNELIIIANESLNIHIDNVYKVQKDPHRTRCWHPLSNNKGLYNILSNISIPSKLDNMSFYHKKILKIQKHNRLETKLWYRIYARINRDISSHRRRYKHCRIAESDFFED